MRWNNVFVLDGCCLLFVFFDRDIDDKVVVVVLSNKAYTVVTEETALLVP